MTKILGKRWIFYVKLLAIQDTICGNDSKILDYYYYYFGFGVYIPISISIYLKDNFSIGYENKFGLLFNVSFNIAFNIINYSSILHKIGNNKGTHQLLILYGTITQINFEYFDYYNGIWFGPALSVGFEYNNKNLFITFLGNTSIAFHIDILKIF